MADNVVDNWESLGEDELEKRLKALDAHFPTPAAAASLQNDSIHRRSGSAPQLYEDVPRYFAQPQIRIMKRQDGSSSQLPALSQAAPPKPVRTLEEREAAYAEARLRIFGNNYVGGVQEENSKSTESTVSLSVNGWLPANICRLPKGPDGTKGFTTARHPNR